MKRIPEPELMDGYEQAKAYADADFEEPHRRVIELFDNVFPGTEISGAILDLGCGPGDIAFRFAYRFPGSSVIGIDGSCAMIELANERKDKEKNISDRSFALLESINTHKVGLTRQLVARLQLGQDGHKN